MSQTVRSLLMVVAYTGPLTDTERAYVSTYVSVRGGRHAARTRAGKM